jgi:hypothetical protein
MSQILLNIDQIIFEKNDKKENRIFKCEEIGIEQ